MIAAQRALLALDPYSPRERLALVARRLSGSAGGPLAAFQVGSELLPDDGRLDGRLLEAVLASALGGARGAIFTGAAEARLLAALGLSRAAARRGVPEAVALACLTGARAPDPALTRALEGLRVLDPCCGGGALLAAALAVARRCGSEPVLLGGDVAPLAAEATRARLRLLGARAGVRRRDALAHAWPAADLVLSNPPFLRHESLAPVDKARAAARSGLSRQADLSAHLAAVALRHAPDVAFVWPRALDTSRSAGPLLADARARGGFAFRLRSRVAGSFAASVDTALAVWSAGHPGRPTMEACVPLPALSPREVAGLATGAFGARLRTARGDHGEGVVARGALRIADVCRVRFGMKSGCNGFFHLKPMGGGHYESALAGRVALAPGDVHPILASLKEAAAPEVSTPARVLFRPERDTATARSYAAAGEALGVPRRPSCAGRSPWWLVAPGRRPAPVLYPAKIGARAFAYLNAEGIWEDKKWHALFPGEGLEPWLLALVLGSTPVRLAVDRAARQLTGMQAIADVDCRVLGAAPFPAPAALEPMRASLEACREALARDPVSTDVSAMLERPAQRELDALVGRALGLGVGDVAAARREMSERVTARLTHAADVRAAVARAAAAR